MRMLVPALLGALLVPVPGVEGAEPAPWLLRSGDLVLGERTLRFGLGVRGKEARGDEAREKAAKQLERLRGRLVLAAAALSRGLDRDPVVRDDISRFRAAHLADLLQQERIIEPARVAAAARAGDPKEREAAFKAEEDRLYRTFAAAAAREFPAEILAKSLPPPGAGDNPVVARVAGTEIRAEEVRRGQNRVAHPGKREGTEDRVFMTVLDSILAEARFAAIAEREGFASRPDVAEVLAEHRVRVLADRYVESIVYPTVRVTDAGLEEYYARSREELRRGEEREIFEILLGDKAQASAVAQRLATGMAFADAVREFSVGPTKEKGGFIGYLSRGEVHPALDAAIAALGPGQISPVVKTPFGWHILRCGQVVQGRTPPLEEVRPTLERSLLDSLRASALAAEIVRLATEHPVQVNEERYQEILKGL